MFLVRTVREELSKRGYVAPRLELIERLCFEARKRAERRVCRVLMEYIDTSQQTALDGLLQTKDDSSLSYLSWLRNPPHAATAPSLLRMIDRVVSWTLTLTDPLVLTGVDPQRAQQCRDLGSIKIAVEPVGLWARGAAVWARGGQQGCCPCLVHTSAAPVRRTRPQVHRLCAGSLVVVLSHT